MPTFKKGNAKKPVNVTVEDELEPPVKWHERRWEFAMWLGEMTALTLAVAVGGFVTVLLLSSFAKMLVAMTGNFWISLFVGVVLLLMLVKGFFWTLHKVLKGTSRDPNSQGDTSHAE